MKTYKIKVGTSTNGKIVMPAGEYVSIADVRKVEEELADYKECQDDKRRLTKEIDIIINGNDAAEQASLCDIVAQLKKMFPNKSIRQTIAEVKEERDRLRGDLKKALDENMKCMDACIQHNQQIATLTAELTCKYCGGRIDTCGTCTPKFPTKDIDRLTAELAGMREAYQLLKKAAIRVRNAGGCQDNCHKSRCDKCGVTIANSEFEQALGREAP